MNRYAKNHDNTSLAENSRLNNVKFRGTDLIIMLITEEEFKEFLKIWA
jgi:hypothetical protein